MSKLLTQEFYENYCNKIFGQPLSPNIDYYLNLYGGTDFKGEKIFFTGSVDDPWLEAGLKELKWWQDGIIRLEKMNCEDCGHCRDLGKVESQDDESVLRVRQQIAS